MDLHRRNVIISDSGPTAIDWLDAGAATLEVDFALNAAYAATDHMAASGRATVEQFFENYRVAGGPAHTDAAGALVAVVSRIAAARAELSGSGRARRFLELSE